MSGHRVHLPVTTHTRVLDQLAEINAALKRPSSPVVAVAGLEPAPTGDLPAEAVLVRVCADGPPEYPYLHAHFRLGNGNGGESDTASNLQVELHTSTLQQISRQLGLRQWWGF